MRPLSSLAATAGCPMPRPRRRWGIFFRVLHLRVGKLKVGSWVVRLRLRPRLAAARSSLGLIAALVRLNRIAAWSCARAIRAVSFGAICASAFPNSSKLHGFADSSAVLTGPETRSSSPIRMVRGENFQARLTSDLPDSDEEPATRVYPCGEGAGYAGGIMSAAVDGLRVAEAIAAEFSSR